MEKFFDKILPAKDAVITSIYAGIGLCLKLLGGWDSSLQVLVVLMAVDFISGLVLAGFFHKSSKSPNGGLESRAGLKGLVRKFGILMIVLCCHQMDALMGLDYIRDTVIIGFCANEFVSILENARKMDLPIFGFLNKLADALLDQVEQKGEKENGI